MERTATAGRNRLIRPLLPGWTAFVSLLLTLGFAVFIMAALAGFHAGDTLLRSNPFADYEMLWPGQSINSVAAYAQRTSTGYIRCLSGKSLNHEYPGLLVDIPSFPPGALDATLRCQMKTDNSVFHTLSLIVSDDRVQLLQMFSDSLPQDSLLLYWGAPDAISWSAVDQSLHLNWNRSSYSFWATVSANGNIVKLVKLTANNAVITPDRQE